MQPFKLNSIVTSPLDPKALLAIVLFAPSTLAQATTANNPFNFPSLSVPGFSLPSFPTQGVAPSALPSLASEARQIAQSVLIFGTDGLDSAIASLRSEFGRASATATSRTNSNASRTTSSTSSRTPSTNSNNGTSAGVVAGSVIGAIVILAVIGTAVYCCQRRRRRSKDVEKLLAGNREKRLELDAGSVRGASQTQVGAVPTPISRVSSPVPQQRSSSESRFPPNQNPPSNPTQGSPYRPLSPPTSLTAATVGSDPDPHSITLARSSPPHPSSGSNARFSTPTAPVPRRGPLPAPPQGVTAAASPDVKGRREVAGEMQDRRVSRQHEDAGPVVEDGGGEEIPPAYEDRRYIGR